MTISVIVPFYNSGADLAECVAALDRQRRADSEIILVDDASARAPSVVQSHESLRLFRLAKNSGPAAARNHGARHARGEILFFVDADVVVDAGALERVQKTFDEQAELAAVFGSYDAEPRSKGMVSQYRNLLHHFVHQNGDPEATTFWAGCGAIRKSVFEQIGGFDEKRFAKASIEDIELGYRLRAAGYRIWLDKELQGKHLKHWSFASMVRTDICNRAIPWSRLILQTKNLPNDLNLRQSQRASFILAVCACTFLSCSFLEPRWLLAMGLAVGALVALNRSLYIFFLRRRGVIFAGTALALQLLYYLYSGFSYVYVLVEMQLRRVLRSMIPKRSANS